MPIHLIAILGLYLLCWQGYKLRRRVNGLGHIALIASLLATLANSLTARWSAATPHTALDGQYISLVEHIFVVISVAGLYVFRLAVEGCRINHRRVRRTIAGAVAVSLGFLLLTLGAIGRGRLLSVTAASFRDPLGFAYNFGAGLYYGLTMTAIAVWMVRFTREKEWHFKAGMRVAALGLFVIGSLCLVRAIPVAVVFLRGPELLAPPWMLGGVTAVAFPLVFLGLSYPVLASRCAALRSWAHQRREDHHTHIVWQLATVAFPEVVLQPATMSERFRRLIRWPDQMQRRRTETFDALAKLLLTDSRTDRTPTEESAADRLRGAVRRYDAAHDTPVVSMVAPSSTALDLDRTGVPGPPQASADADMLRELADLLRQPHDDDLSRVTA